MRKELKLGHALIALVLLLLAMVLSTIVWKIAPHVPLIFGCIVVGVIVKTQGFCWGEIIGYTVDGIAQSMEALLILMLIGILMAVWLTSGTVPAMMYYGLRIIDARFFFVSAFLLCAATSMVLGSWGTAGTLGIAILGISKALGLPAAMTVGAIVSGAYVGDKASPLTDCLNLTAGVSGCDMKDIIKRLVKILWKVLLAAAILYLLAGFKFGAQESPETIAQRQTLLTAIKSEFHVSPLLLLPFVVTVGCALMGIPAIPSIMAGIAGGLILAVTVQNRSAADAFGVCYSGYINTSGIQTIEQCLSGGGIESMMYTVSLAMIALGFGGLMTGTKLADVLIGPLLKRINSPFGMILLTVGTAVFVNAVLPDQYLSIAMCGQLYTGHYKDKGVDGALFANAVSAGAITSALIPWNSCGVYLTSIFGVGTAEYLPFAWFNLLMPLGMILAALFQQLKKRRGRGTSLYNSTRT